MMTRQNRKLSTDSADDTPGPSARWYSYMSVVVMWPVW